MKFSLFMLLSVMLSNCLAAPFVNTWGQVSKPSAGASQSIGSYTAGCLSGAATLPVNGEGYQVMRLSRQRFYGHPELVHFIEHLGQAASLNKWGTLLVGDLGQPRGGPTLTGHRSHQSGLDVDMWYLLSPVAATRQLAAAEREKWGAPSVLRAGSDDINLAQWSVANERILEAAAKMPEVERIFVHAGVKRLLCSRHAGADWLRKVRPWWGHDDHFHVRLKCPADSKVCQGQEAIPAGDGCDAGLAWWFSAEAKAELTKKKAGPRQMPVLPAECASVLIQ
ncbi:MAG: penicillin-insensitive murein endopeptidase [Methylococcales bacterium]